MMSSFSDSDLFQILFRHVKPLLRHLSPSSLLDSISWSISDPTSISDQTSFSFDTVDYVEKVINQSS